MPLALSTSYVLQFYLDYIDCISLGQYSFSPRASVVPVLTLCVFYSILALSALTFSLLLFASCPVRFCCLAKFRSLFFLLVAFSCVGLSLHTYNRHISNIMYPLAITEETTAPG